MLHAITQIKLSLILPLPFFQTLTQIVFFLFKMLQIFKKKTGSFFNTIVKWYSVQNVEHDMLRESAMSHSDESLFHATMLLNRHGATMACK